MNHKNIGTSNINTTTSAMASSMHVGDVNNQMDFNMLSDMATNNPAVAVSMFSQLAPPNDSLNSHGANGVPRILQLDFEKEEKKIQQFENINKKFHKDVKTYIDRIDDLNKSETKMINNLNNFINQSDKSSNATLNSKSSTSTSNLGPTDSHGTGRKSSVSTLNQRSSIESNASSITTANEEDFTEKFKVWRDILQSHNRSCDDLKQSCQTKVIEPIKKLNLLFPNVYSAIKRREQAYKEFLNQQNRLNRAQEKERTGPNLVRIEEYKQAANAAKQQFLKEHLFLMEELPKLYNSRLEYIKPCVNSLLEAQSNFYEKYASFYEKILSSNKQNENRDTQTLQNKPTVSSTRSSADGSLNRSFGAKQTANLSSMDPSRLQFTNMDDLDKEINEYLSQIKELSIVDRNWFAHARSTIKNFYKFAHNERNMNEIP